jgi:uncharacterized protein (TIGR04540 family)
LITYFKTQLDLIKALIDLIDDYWNLKINEKDFIRDIKQICKNNEELLFKEGDYVSSVKQRLGVKRLTLLDKILERE